MSKSSKDQWLRSHVERCLQDIWDQCRVVADPDGDYPFRHGTAACYVRIENVSPRMIRVWAIAAGDVRRTAKLLGELNDVNSRSRSAWASWSGGLVTVEQAIHLDGLSRRTLRHALTSVGSVADDIGGMIAAVYGGSTPFAPDEPSLAEGAA